MCVMLQLAHEYALRDALKKVDDERGRLQVGVAKLQIIGINRMQTSLKQVNGAVEQTKRALALGISRSLFVIYILQQMSGAGCRWV